MKAHFRFLCLCLALLCVGVASRAQLTGSITVPSATYPTLASVITALNTQGVGAGGAIINFTPATNEVAPVGGYRLGSATLNASTSTTNRLVFNGNGNLITGYVGTSTTADGIFYIQGTDYVTINNLNLIDPATNTTTTTQMEWGYSLVKLSGTAPFDGCQNVTINGCTITLIKTNVNTIGIRAAHTIASTATILTTTGTTVASTNSYNNFTGNTISGVTRGINLIGITSGVAVYDKNNKIGGTTPASGNKITIGGSTNASYGTYTQYDSVITIQNNNFYIGTGQTTTVYESYLATGVGNLSVMNNRYDINCAIATTVAAYYNPQQHSDPGVGVGAASTHTITGNTITGTNTLSTTSTFYGIYEYYNNSKYLIVNNNAIRDISWNGTIYGMYIYYTNTPYQTVDNNLIYNITNLYTSGYIYGIYNYNYNSPYGRSSVSNNTVRKITSRYFIYSIYDYFSYAVPPTGYTGQVGIANSNWVDSIDQAGATTAYLYNYFGMYGLDSSQVSYNKVTNINGPTTGSLYMYNYSYGYYAPNLYTVRGNFINNINANILYNYNYLGYYGTMTDSNIVSNYNLTGTSGYIYNYMGMYPTNGCTVSNNRVDKINTAGCYLYNYVGCSAANAEVKYNAFTNINLGGAGYFYNLIGYSSADANVHHNRIDSITQATSTTFYPFYTYGTGTTHRVHDNIVSNLTTTSTSIAFYPYYLFTAGATTTTHFYNNLLTNVNLPTAYSGISSAGVYLATGAPFNVYNNTIRINPGITGGANYGFTGIYFLNTVLLDLRNNIINVNVTPTGTGFAAALRNSSGTAGVSPANFLGTSNGNIYYTPNVTNSWLYGEGTSAAGMVNTYNLTNDPNFNTPCGKFKSFMGHDQASFTENNLVAGTLPGTYVPTSISYAEKGGVPTGNPAVITDYAGVTRGPVVDMGALEFAGTSLDNAPPIISYTPVPIKSYCTSAPTLLVTITDSSGVNNTTGTAPRLYFKKSNSATNNNNAFGANNNTTNGWKYVEPTNINGSVYTFIFDYSLLTSGVGPGDSITYFIIAQDNASTPNTGASVVGFPICPPTVALGSTHGPTNASPKPNGFKILNTPIFQAVGFPGSVCGSGSSVISVNPLPVGASVQWQTATLTGTFSNITGATNTSYTTPVNTTTLLYRALIYCGSTVLATSTVDTFVVAKPSGQRLGRNEFSNVLLYPNPANDQITIRNDKNEMLGSVTIYDGSGRTVYQEHADAVQALITVKDLSPGIYYVRSNRTGLIKFIKQ